MTVKFKLSFWRPKCRCMVALRYFVSGAIAFGEIIEFWRSSETCWPISTGERTPFGRMRISASGKFVRHQRTFNFDAHFFDRVNHVALELAWFLLQDR